MGVVVKQTVKGSIYTYIGAIIGGITVAFIQPKVISPEQVGLLYLLNDFALTFAAFAALGFSSTIRYFPYFRNSEKKHHGYLFLAGAVALVGFLLVVLVILLFKDQIISQKSQDSFLFSEYYYYLIPLTFFFLYFNVFELFARVNYNTIFSQFLRELLKRALWLVLYILLLFKVIGFDGFMPLWLVASILPTLILFWYISRMNTFSLKSDIGFLKQNKPLVSNLIKISSFTMIVGTAPYIIGIIDRYMVNQVYGLGQAGIYSIVLYLSGIIAMPTRSLYSITTPVVAEAWKQNDRETISTLYRKTCLNQLIFSVLLFIGIWGNQHNIFTYLPEYEPGKYILLFLGLANVMRMGAGINGVIIATSKYYRYDGLSYLLLIGFTILANLIFLPIYGMTGAAISTLITTMAFNLFRYFLVWKAFKMQPFGWSNLVVLLIGALTYFAVGLIPYFDNFIIDLIIRSITLAVVFIGATYALRLSPDFNGFVNASLSRLKKRFAKGE